MIGRLFELLMGAVAIVWIIFLLWIGVILTVVYIEPIVDFLSVSK